MHKEVKNLKKRITSIGLTSMAMAIVASTYALPALAEQITSQDASSVTDKIVTVLDKIFMPLGALVIFVAIGFTAFKMITTANKPSERADAMGSLPYIFFGGIILGGIFLFAGLIFGIMTDLHG